MTVICPLADSYVAAAAREAGSAAEEAATRKSEKYSNIQADHIFKPVLLPLSHWVQPVRRVAFSSLISVASLSISRAMTEKLACYFSDSPFRFISFHICRHRGTALQVSSSGTELSLVHVVQYSGRQ